MPNKISLSRAVEQIKDFVDGCDGDTLAAIYQDCFAAISSAIYDEGLYNSKECLIVEYTDGFGPDEVPFTTNPHD